MLVRSGLPVLPVLVTVLVLAVLVLFVLAALVPAVLAVLVLVDRSLLAEAVCAFNGSGPTRASISSNAANITGRVQLAKLGDKKLPGDMGSAPTSLKTPTLGLNLANLYHPQAARGCAARRHPAVSASWCRGGGNSSE